MRTSNEWMRVRKCAANPTLGPRDGTCTSADKGFSEWARDINGCGGDGVLVQTKPLAKMGKVGLGEEAAGRAGGLHQGDVGVTCVEAVDCVGRTVSCAHEGAGHFGNFPQAFPLNMKLAAFEFFEQHATDADFAA
jgi:hypothetical protein